ncbi:hypothetical protein MKW92_046853 [Papaver armeniacum]|nr:hypothetical protein MKW92_046853 [Papaver armeniacum]
MSFKSGDTITKVLKKLGAEKLGKGVKETVKKFTPSNSSKITMGRAKRGLYGGVHIQFGDQVSEDGGNRTRRTWKPNVQEKQLFSYILDRHVRVKVTTHALRCIDKAGGVDEYLLKTPYQKMDTEIGSYWKSTIEKMYEERGQMDIRFFSPEEKALREARRKGYKGLGQQKKITEEISDLRLSEKESSEVLADSDVHEPLVAQF